MGEDDFGAGSSAPMRTLERAAHRGGLVSAHGAIGFRHPRRARKKWRGTPRRAQHDRKIRRGQRSRAASHVCIRSLAKSKLVDPRPLAKIYNTGWKSARERAADAWAQAHGEAAPEGFRKIRVHDRRVRRALRLISLTRREVARRVRRRARHSDAVQSSELVDIQMAYNYYE